MFSYKIEANENNQWTEVHGWVRPFTDGQTLDDSLDSGKIMISQSTREAIIKPFTRVRITIKEDDAEKDTIDCIVANSDRVMRRLSGRGHVREDGACGDQGRSYVRGHERGGEGRA